VGKGERVEIGKLSVVKRYQYVKSVIMRRRGGERRKKSISF